MNKDNKINIEMEQQNKPVENVDPKIALDEISSAFISSRNSATVQIEMEAKFGTKGIKHLTKMDYDNVVSKLLSLGYEINDTEGIYMLRIQPEFIDTRTGQYKTSGDFDRFRIEIKTLDAISKYCKNNDLSIIEQSDGRHVSIMKKTNYQKPSSSGKERIVVPNANFDDFNFRVTLKREETINKVGKIGVEVFEKWNGIKKVFRYINRVSLFPPKDSEYYGCFMIDMSIVRSSNKNERGWLIQEYNVEASNVFKNPETYEIEIEVLPDAKNKFSNNKELSSALQKVVKHVLSGLQKTNYPISYSEQRKVFEQYQQLLFEEDYKQKGERFVPKQRPYSSDFIGPSLVTLGLQNIAPLNPDVTIPNITEPGAYCVTDKADGERTLLFVNEKGRIYLINTNWNVMFTGLYTNEQKCFNSLLDGELIYKGIHTEYLNRFAAFDAYFINNIDIRMRPFVNSHIKEEKYFKDGCRLPILKEFVKQLKPIPVTTSEKKPLTITTKLFYPTFETSSNSSTYNIFEATSFILRKIANKQIMYEIDGLIYTPTLLGVGSSSMLEAGPKRKVTWEYCFKWKPSVATSIFPKGYNTIDFLVSTKKGADGKDIITPIFENGTNNSSITQYNQYKTLILTVGFDQSKHGYINPCQDVLDDKFVSKKNDIDNDEGYKPKQFFPSNPYDPLAGLCNIMLEKDSNDKYTMFTEERQAFEDNTVVEFRYDSTKEGLWKWIPMRVRYDKTLDFRNGNGVGANDYTTANNNWTTIHYPVTERMLSTGQGIPNFEVSDDVYYNSVTADKLTKGMRDFHNLYVKKLLIQGVSKKGDTLIDLCCGKAGDLPKWINAGLSFVFGIDVSKDNIENRINGACARYLNYRKTNKNMPYALFVNGNASMNIRSGTNMFTDKANEITKSIFGSKGVDNSLGPAVVRQHGKVHNGFNVTSCQFALHYMFENKNVFYNFMRNVAECTKLYGYFIATCYDGQEMFKLLKRKEEGERDEIYVNDKLVWYVEKQYDATTLEDDDSCLGLKIDVYQDSINQTIPEYLVNFDFLTSTMEKYGFSLVSREEARRMGFSEGSGMFSELYNSMMSEVKRYPEKEHDYKDALYMREYEKDISFLNRFFIYKKTSTRNVDKLTKALLGQIPDQVDYELEGTEVAREAVKEAEEAIHSPKVLKTKAKSVNKTKKNKPAKVIINDDEEVENLDL